MFGGESRGSGFVEMPNNDEAEKAIPALKGIDMKARNLALNAAGLFLLAFPTL